MQSLAFSAAEFILQLVRKHVTNMLITVDVFLSSVIRLGRHRDNARHLGCNVRAAVKRYDDAFGRVDSVEELPPFPGRYPHSPVHRLRIRSI
jgi:hypothetical protein